MIARIKKSRSEDQRFDFVSSFVADAVNRSDLSLGEVWKWSLQIDIQRIINQEFELAISSLCQSVRETQCAAAYLLLAEAYAQSGQIEMALMTLDVLKYVDSDLPEAEMMKGFLLREKGDYAEARKCLQAAVRARPALRIAWKELIDMELDRGDPHEAARLLSEALRHDARNGQLIDIQGSLSEVNPVC